jgi:2-polyprenyl-6-methoxyphenol hydroxylase-like FAD-dependent oxidoreductase
MEKTTCIVVGAGPAGAACAYTLAKKGIDTVLLERGREPDERKSSPVSCPSDSFTESLDRMTCQEESGGSLEGSTGVAREQPTALWGRDSSGTTHTE